MALGIEGLDQVVVPVVSLGRLDQCLDEAPGGIDGGGGVHRHAQGREDLFGVPFEDCQLPVIEGAWPEVHYLKISIGISRIHITPFFAVSERVHGCLARWIGGPPTQP